MALISKPSILPWDASSVWSPPQLWGGKQRHKENQSTTSKSLCLHWILWTHPPFVYLGLFHFSPQNRSQTLILSTFLTYWVFYISIVSHCLTWIKIYWLNTTSFMPTFLGMQWWKIWTSAFVPLIFKRKCLHFQFLSPSTFSNEIGKQPLIVISLNVCSTMNLLGLSYSKYHLLTCENYSSLLSR